MRSRIIGLAVWISVLATALFGVPLGVAVLQYAVHAERSELHRIADAIAIAVASHVYDGERIEDLDQRGSVVASVYDEEGELLGGALPNGAPAELSKALQGKVATGEDSESLIVAVPVTHEDDVTGAVLATTPRSAVLQEVALAWAAMAALALLAVAATWLVARRQARRLAHPLEELAAAARRLGDGDFSVRTRGGGITEIDAVGTALDSTAVRLDNLLARERAFSAEASHQLRTPLAGLRLWLEAALLGADQQLRPAFAASLADADRLEMTIDELLALARHTRGASPEAVDPHALLDEVVPAWCECLARLDRELHVEMDPEVPAVRGSAAALRQVLAVLVENATTHGAGTVTVRVRNATDAVAIDVADEGPGIAGPERALFAQRPHRGGGHGIGLALARRLAEARTAGCS